MYRSNTQSSGFTIIELIIVVVIIGILVAIVSASYVGITKNAEEKSAAAMARQVGDKAKLYQVNNGSYPDSMASLDLGGPDESKIQYEKTDEGFCVTTIIGKSSAFTTQSSIPGAGGCPGHAQSGRPAIINLALNPSAEKFDKGWYSNNSADYPRIFDSSKARTGNYSVSSAHKNVSNSLLSLYAIGAQEGSGFPVESNKPYTVSVYFTSDVPHKGYMYCSFRSNGAYTTVGSAPQITGKVGEWTRTSYTCNSPANTDRLRIIGVVLSLTSQPAGTKAYMDDFMVTEGTTLYEYSDGNTQDWMWKGEQNYSISVGPALL